MAQKYIHLDLYTGDTSIMNPEEVADYAYRLNNAIYSKLIKGD